MRLVFCAWLIAGAIFYAGDEPGWIFGFSALWLILLTMIFVLVMVIIFITGWLRISGSASGAG